MQQEDRRRRSAFFFSIIALNSFPNSLESSKAHFDSKLLSKSTCSKASCHAIRIRFILDKRKKIKQKWHGLQFCHESIFFWFAFFCLSYLSLSNFILSGSARLTGKISYLKYDPPVRVLPLHERLAGMRAEILNGSGRTTAYEFMGVTSPNLVELFVKELSIVYSYANGSAADYMAMRLSACKKSMPSSICNNKWRLERSRDSGEILYSLRSIAKYMPWFKGHIYIVTPTGKGPEYFNYSNPKLHIIHQKDIMSQDTIPSFANDCQEYFLTNVKGLKDRFIILMTIHL